MRKNYFAKLVNYMKNVLRYFNMSKKYVVALDEGTTGLRAVIFNKNSEIVAMKSSEISQYFPRPGPVGLNITLLKSGIYKNPFLLIF